jgi:DNA-binding winged helix-turn-helix (wHTH) protein
MERRISKIAIFRARRRFLIHVILYIFINISIIIAWLDPYRVNLTGDPGLLLSPLLWTPIFLIHLSSHYILEQEHKNLQSFDQKVDEAPLRKRKRGHRAAGDFEHGKCDESKQLQVNEFTLCLSNQSLTTPYGEMISLTRTECRLMQLFMSHSGHPLPINYIYQEVWGYGPQDMSALKNTIYRLRRKIEAVPNEPCHLVFVPDEGYVFLPDL